MRNLFQKLFSLLRHRRGFLFTAIALLAAACAWRASRISLKENILDMLPAREKTVDDFTGIFSRFGYQNRLFFDISAGTGPSAAAAAADELYEQLQKSGYFKRFIYRVNTEQGMATLGLMGTYLPALFGPEEQDYAASSLTLEKVRARLEQDRKNLLELPVTGPFSQSISRDPLGLQGIFLSKLTGYQYGARVEDGRIWSGDGKHIMLVAIPDEAKAGGKRGPEAAAFIERARKAVAEAHPDAAIRYIGSLRITEDNREMMRRDMVLTTNISTLLVLLLSLAVYRRAFLVLLSTIPVVFGGLLALGCFAFYSDEMSAIVAGFGGVLIGIAVDYAVYILYRYDYFEGPFGDAERINRHLSVITAPIVMGAATTMAAFLCLLLSTLPGQRQLGLFAAIGIGGAAFFSLAVLPHLLSPRPPKRKKPMLPLGNVWSDIFEWNRRHTWLCLGFTVVVSLGAFLGIRKVTFDGDLNNLSGMRAGTRADETAISREWGGQFFKKTLIAVRGTTMEEAQQKNDRLYSLLMELQQKGTIEKLNSLSPLAPSLRTQGENSERWSAFWNPAHQGLARRNLEAAGRREGFAPSAFSPFYRSLRQKSGTFPLEAFREGPLGELVGGFISEEKGESLILTEVQAGTGYEALEGRVLEQMPDALVYNGDAFARRISVLVLKVLWLFTWVSLAAALVILLIGYGSLEIILVIAGVLILDAFWSLGLMGWLGIPINLMNNIFILFIHGMCADYAIFVVSAFLSLYADPGEDIGVAGGATALAALTAIGGFGTLVLASHPALHSIGITATLVMIIGLVTVALALPLAMRLLLWKNGRHGTPTLHTAACGVAAFSFFGLGLIFCRLFFIPWIRFRYPDKPADRRKAVQSYLRTTTRLLLGSLPYGKRVFLNAEPKAFEEPAVIVCNHQSVIDIISALTLPADIRMVVKPWVWNSFLIGPAIREAGYILTDGWNADEVLEKAENCLREGDSLLFFPEGTRSETGRIGRYKKGAFEAAIKAKAEILPIVMCETRSCIPKSGFWIGDHRLVVSVMPRINTRGKESLALARQTKILMVEEYEKSLAVACAGPEFFKRIQGQYHYLGPQVERFVARRLRRDPLCREILGFVPREAVILDLGQDYGLLANILAAESTRRSVIGFARDPEMARVALKASVSPERTRYEAHEKMDGGEFPAVAAVLLSMGDWLPLDSREAVLLKAIHCLKRGGRLVLREISPGEKESYSECLRKYGFFEVKTIENVIIAEKSEDGPDGL